MPLPRPAAGTGRWWALGIVFTLIVGGWLAYREYAIAGERVTARTVGFSVLDDRTTTIDYEVTKPPETTVVCTLQAQDIRHAVVGSATETVGPSPQRVVRQVSTIRTTTEAYAAEVYSCVRS